MMSRASLFTKLGQTDYAAEIAQIREANPDSVFFFLPGGMGIAFLKQHAAAGLDIPVYGPAFSFDEIILGAVGDAALGVKNTSQWAYDLDNATNKAFVESFRAEYGRTPTLYASQGFDTANLILSALDQAPASDKDAFRAALKAAKFSSVRGDFKFGNNNHPIQDILVREVVALVTASRRTSWSVLRLKTCRTRSPPIANSKHITLEEGGAGRVPPFFLAKRQGLMSGNGPCQQPS